MMRLPCDVWDRRFVQRWESARTVKACARISAKARDYFELRARFTEEYSTERHYFIMWASLAAEDAAKLQGAQP